MNLRLTIPAAVVCLLACPSSDLVSPALATEGDADPEAAVAAGVEWLVRNQTANGSWSGDGSESVVFTPGLTGLSVLALLDAGHTLTEGEHQEAVKRGVRYLETIQDDEGCLGPRSHPQWIYNHAIGALALARAYGASDRPEARKAAAQKAVDFLAVARNPYFAWRYGVKPGDDDPSVTAWAMHALHEAEAAELVVDEQANEGALALLQKVTDPDYGRAGYLMRGSGPARPMELMDEFPAHLSESMTAAGLSIRLMIGGDAAKGPVFDLGVKLLRGVPPKTTAEDGSPLDYYYWWWGAYALQQVGGDAWTEWRAALDTALVATQKTEGDDAGSWDPDSVWGKTGGRVYVTAINTRTLVLRARGED